jgi:hypothetical protein
MQCWHALHRMHMAQAMSQARLMMQCAGRRCVKLQPKAMLLPTALSKQSNATAQPVAEVRVYETLASFVALTTQSVG